MHTCQKLFGYMSACAGAIFPQDLSPEPSAPTPNVFMQQHHLNIRHRSPTFILTLHLPPSLTHTHTHTHAHTHLILPILSLLLILPTPAHLFCTSLMVTFSEFDDLLWMHVYHVHAVMHIVMLKWCIRCYISCGLT